MTGRVSRRGLLGAAAGTVGGALGATIAAPGLLASAAAADTAPTSYPFDGPHQQGILTPTQRASSFVSFDVTADTRKELQEALQSITTRARFLTAGGTPLDNGLTATTVDNGILGPTIPADGLTVTASVGASLFDKRFGLASKKPAKLRRMPAFADDALDRAQCDGDLLLQICADNTDTVVHALRDIMRATRGALAVRWRMDGFQSPPRPAGASRNLLGFKDGSANPSTADGDAMDQLVWTHGGTNGEPAWVEGGSYQVVRLIRMLVEFWDRVSVHEQNAMIGRDKATGAPLSGTHESDVPDYSHDASGDTIPLDAHIRLASKNGTAAEQRMLRRPYNYDAGTDANGNLHMGLVFVAFNQDLERQFASVQRRLEGEPLVDYISPFGGGYFFALPGAQGTSDWLGRGMFA